MKIDAVQLAGILSYVAKAADMDTADSLAAHIAALEKERDAALADNAALVKAALAVCDTWQGPFENAGFRLNMFSPNGCSVDCIYCAEKNRRHLAAITLRQAVSKQIHPGAALLEEHRKALVRARNEGLEAAAAVFDGHAADADDEGEPDDADNARDWAKIIRAMKEPES